MGDSFNYQYQQAGNDQQNNQQNSQQNNQNQYSVQSPFAGMNQPQFNLAPGLSQPSLQNFNMIQNNIQGMMNQQIFDRMSQNQQNLRMQNQSTFYPIQNSPGQSVQQYFANQQLLGNQPDLSSQNLPLQNNLNSKFIPQQYHSNQNPRSPQIPTSQMMNNQNNQGILVFTQQCIQRCNSKLTFRAKIYLKITRCSI
jgi:hypothetical protein